MGAGGEYGRNAMIDFVDGEVGPNKNVPRLIRGGDMRKVLLNSFAKGGNQ